MNYAIFGTATSATHERFGELLTVALEERGFTRIEEPAAADIVVNLVDEETPKAFRRASKGTFSFGIVERAEVPADRLKANYPILVRSLSNIALSYTPGQAVWFTTMERGDYAELDNGDEADLARRVIARLMPLAQARLVIDNEFREDLEPELWDGDEVTQEIIDAGARMGDLDLLPAPFPIEELLNERDLRHVKLLYGIGGLSYGNLSQRKDETRFWMSASGVDKSKLEIPSRDILLVSGYIEEERKMVISVPPLAEPRRVSVDAIEHWMIYQAHPDVGAILHVHAWMEGIQATQINYPCGSHELAVSVAELIEKEPDPANAAIGLRNHGITVTGPSLLAILDRIEPLVLRQIPMI